MDWLHFALIVVPMALTTIGHIVHASIAAQGKPDHPVLVDNLADFATVISGIANSKSPPQTASAPTAAGMP